MKKIVKLLIGAGLFLILAAILSGCQQAVPEPREERALSVEIMDVSIGNLAVRTTLTGQVHALETVRLTPKMPGSVARVHVVEGDTVSAGQLLISLDQKDIQNSIRQAEAGLAIAQAGYESAEAGLVMAEEQHQQALRELERMLTLYESGAITKQQLEQAELSASETSILSTRSQVNQAQAQVNQARVSLDVARSTLADTEIRSPLNGTVTEMNAVVGEVISGQAPAVSISTLNPVVVKTTVSEYLINRFTTGQEVNISIPAASSELYQGTVSTIAQVPSSGSMTYPMEMEIPNQESLIKVGMFAEIDLTTETRQNVLLVPSEAVVIREGRPVVFLAHQQRAVMREVTIGIDNGQFAEILSGLQAGQRIIFRGQDFLEDGSLIDDVNGRDGESS